MTTFVSDLEPRSLWGHFDRLMEIPRGSKSESAARGFVVAVADRHGLDHVTDEAGNLVVRKPASRGREGAPITVLQAHLDMVQEKNGDVEFDFATEPIRPAREGEWLGADGTTLGADNGIGVAAMLAILEDETLDTGPLELLFTVDEETGLTGARSLPADLLEGRLLINLDSEEEGVITIGCAGGGDLSMRLPLVEAPVEPGGGLDLALSVGGLKGGHSGVDIHLQRGNAIRILARAMQAALDETSARVASFRGGNARNAIPREAEATLRLDDASEEAACREALESSFALAALELRRSDPGLVCRVEASPRPGAAWDRSSSERALALLAALPHGVMAMSLDLPGLVETSTNVAVARQDGDELFVLTHNRSSVSGSLEALRRQVRSIGELAGAAIEQSPAYPAWQPDVDSSLLATIRSVYESTLGDSPEVGAMHAGLECGIIGEKYEGMDMVSFGPQIEFPHSPDERVRIDSVEPFYSVLGATLERIARLSPDRRVGL